MAIEKEGGDFASSVNEFLSVNRKIVLSVLGITFAAVVAVIIFFAVSEQRNKSAVAAIEKVVYDLEEFKKKDSAGTKNTPEGEGLEGAEKELEVSDAVKAEEDKAIEELKLFAAKKASAYAVFRSNSVIAEIYFQRKNYSEALRFYEAAVPVGGSGYTAGIAYFNAAVCADELSDSEKAVSFYKKAAEIKGFPLVPRALFNAGRVYEGMQKNDEALSVYNRLISAYPKNEWGLLAKSRVIVISEGK